LYGGKVDENITQALARIVITDDMLRMQQEGIRCVHQVHDEILSVCPENQAEDVYKEMGIIMATPPSWAPDLPLASEGGWDRRYIK
jgi:DNA polymerase